ncbi:MAG: PAS domain S-box protein, partial [Deltaproteobacteria bacterium]|nr:PAS domain S-box protein [Deltaproteobacteria bacterium]
MRFLFAGVVDAVEDIIFVADCEDRIMYANPAALRKFGYTMEEFLGQKSHFFSSPHNPPHITEVILKETLSKGYWKGEVLNRTKDGVDFPVYLTTGVIR